MVMTMVITEGVVHVIQASEFKAKCLALMDEVARSGVPLLITKNGKPVAELHAPASAARPSPFGLHKGRVAITGDILAPLDVAWDADR